MWPFSLVSRLRGELAGLRLEVTRLTIERQSHGSTLRTLARQVRAAEKRAHEAETALTIQRHDGDRMVRHLTNALLRAKEIGGFPLVDHQPVTKGDGPVVSPPTIDEGELEAVVQAGAELGVSRAEVIALLKKERGLP